MIDLPFLAVIGIVFFAFFTQAATGFGAMVIAMTLSALIYPVDVLLTWFIPLVILLSTYLLARHHAHIDWALFFRRILPAMGVGLVIGQLVFYRLDTAALKTALGVLVIVLALRELMRRAETPRKIPLLPWTFAAGIVHGVFASGGPLLVYGLNGQRLPKAVFRSTLTVVWMVMALVLAGSYVASGALSTATMPRVGVLAAVLPLSIIAGEWVHTRINAAAFARGINVLLVVCGVALLLR